MVEQKEYSRPCPYCHNHINIQDLLPKGTKISFFAEYTLNDDGKFSNGRCFASINNSVRKTKQKEADPTFKKNPQREIF